MRTASRCGFWCRVQMSLAQPNGPCLMGAFAARTSGRCDWSLVWRGLTDITNIFTSVGICTKLGVVYWDECMCCLFRWALYTETDIILRSGMGVQY